MSENEDASNNVKDLYQERGFSVAEHDMIENELECHRLWTEIQSKKGELQILYNAWKACNQKSVYHNTDPLKDFNFNA